MSSISTDIPQSEKPFKTIQLTRGMVAIVDADDYDRLSQWKWYATKSHTSTKYYAQRSMRLTPGSKGKKTVVAMHRFLMDAEPGQLVDHRNGNGLDNRRSNLRFCTKSQNAMNSKSQDGSRSRFKGVYWHSGCRKWVSQIKINGESIRLGLIGSEVEAAIAYDRAAVFYFGEFASLNFPGGLAI